MGIIIKTLKNIYSGQLFNIFLRSKADMMGDEIQSEKEPLKPNTKKIINR